MNKQVMAVRNLYEQYSSLGMKLGKDYEIAMVFRADGAQFLLSDEAYGLKVKQPHGKGNPNRAGVTLPLKKLNAGQRLHAMVEGKRVAATGVAGFGYDQAIRKVRSSGFKTVQRVAHGKRRFEGYAAVAEQGAHGARDVGAFQFVAARQRPTQFSQNNVGHEQSTMFLTVCVEHCLGALSLRLVVTRDKTHQDVGVKRDHLRES